MIKKIQKKRIILKELNWSLELNCNWIHESDEYINSFYNPEGYGALQISTYKQDMKLTKDLLIELENFDEETEFLKEKVYGDFSGYEIKYTDVENIFWRKIWLSKQFIFLYITYNCNVNDRLKEARYIDDILTSLQMITN